VRFLFQEKKSSLPPADHSSSASSSHEEEIDLEDEAIAGEVVAREREEGEPREKECGPQKRRKSALHKKKASVVHHMFSKVADKAGMFECRLHNFELPSSNHPKFVKQGTIGTSNLLSHAREYHGVFVDGLVKAFNEGRDVGQEYNAAVALLRPPERGGLHRFVSTVKRSELLLQRHLSLLVFLISNAIPFHVVSTNSFDVWMRTLGIEYPSVVTLKKYLRPLYAVVLRVLEDTVQKCGYFSTTSDLWTSLAGEKFCVVTYHSMTHDLEMFSAPLDLIPVGCSAFMEFLYLAQKGRIDSHNFDNCVHVASFSDSGANIAAASERLTPGDAEPCFNHSLKNVIDDVLVGSDSKLPSCDLAALDFRALDLIISYIRASQVVSLQFDAEVQHLYVKSMQLVKSNLTRWEGRYKALCRVLKVQKALDSMHAKGTFCALLDSSPKAFPADFLTPTFWRRLEISYEPLLRVCHIASKSAQTVSSPSLSSVPFHVSNIRRCCLHVEDDSLATRNFKSAFLAAVEKRLLKYCTVVLSDVEDGIIVPNAVKAALLDPRFSQRLQDQLTREEMGAVCTAIMLDTATLFPENAPHEVLETQMKTAFPFLLQKLTRL
jgi:hypothetical protein